MSFRFLISVFLLSGFALSMAANAAPPETLDRKHVHSDYNEGNFEKVISALEGFMARNKSYSQSDSLFIVKHLAVVYSANPQTREKGKYYMYQLLSILPSAKLVDMYVSDEIDRIFEKVREEFMVRQKSFGVDSSELALPEKSNPQIAKANPASETPGSKSSSSKTSAAAQPAVADRSANQSSAKNPAVKDRNKGSNIGYIVAGGAALVAVGTATYFMFGETPKKTEKIYDIP